MRMTRLCVLASIILCTTAFTPAGAQSSTRMEDPAAKPGATPAVKGSSSPRGTLGTSHLGGNGIFVSTDDCSAPTPISGIGSHPFDTTTAVSSGFSGGGSCSAGASSINQDLFWQWTVTTSGDYQIDTFGSSFDTKLSVHSGVGCAAICVAYNDDSGGTLQSRIQLTNLIAGDTFVVQVGGFGSASGTGVLNITHLICPPGGPTLQQVYELDGPPNGTFWSWSLSGPGFSGVSDLSTGGINTTVDDLAAAFALAIQNAASAAGCAASIDASAGTSGIPGQATLIVDVAAPSFVLMTGPAGGPPACTPVLSPAAPNCVINPTIRQIPLSGLDCNGSGRDDVLDIALGFSQDANGNWVPDECEALTSFCPGDGSGTPCPCSNPGGPGRGCANGSHAGARLAASGSSSWALDDLVLEVDGSTASQPGIFFQGTAAVWGGLGSPFGDGLFCVAGSTVRLEVRFSDPFGNAASTSSLIGTGGVAPGQIHLYQWWYRDTAGSLCNSGFNLSNALEVIWLP